MITADTKVKHTTKELTKFTASIATTEPTSTIEKKNSVHITTKFPTVEQETMLITNSTIKSKTSILTKHLTTFPLSTFSETTITATTRPNPTTDPSTLTTSETTTTSKNTRQNASIKKLKEINIFE